MHELSICEGILEVARRALAATRPPPRVARLAVRVGRLTSVVPDSLRFYFELLTPGTLFQGATLDIEEVPIRARCGSCGAEFEIEILSFACPKCASGVIEILSGRELQLVSLETTEESQLGN